MRRSMPPSVIVFIDTEFTDLCADAELLSIGLVAAETTDELYIELSDADRSGASDFVTEVVFPLLGMHDPEILPRQQAGQRIDVWFDLLRGGDRNRPIICVSDSMRDWQYLLTLYPPGNRSGSWAQARNVAGRLINDLLTSEAQQFAYADAVEMYFRRHGREQHHALVDARSLKEGYRQARRD